MPHFACHHGPSVSLHAIYTGVLEKFQSSLARGAFAFPVTYAVLP